jgi:hypothetical protein
MRAGFREIGRKDSITAANEAALGVAATAQGSR